MHSQAVVEIPFYTRVICTLTIYLYSYMYVFLPDKNRFHCTLHPHTLGGWARWVGVWGMLHHTLFSVRNKFIS